MNEIYKDIAGFEDKYEVSSLGNVRNKITGRLLKPFSDGRKGYLQVSLCKDNQKHYFKIHRLVALAFLPNPNNYPQVNHIDEDKSNNSVENLEWCTNQYNVDYSISKPVNQFSLDGRLLNTYKSTQEASRQTGVNQQSISECCLGKRYKTTGGFIWKYV